MSSYYGGEDVGGGAKEDASEDYPNTQVVFKLETGRGRGFPELERTTWWYAAVSGTES